MRVWHSVSDWRRYRERQPRAGIGLVPTMGALHRGHAELVRRTRAESASTVVTIFVNPSQFNDPKDLERYPRTLQADLDLLSSLDVDHVLVPPAGDLYPFGYRVRLDAAGGAAEGLEGSYRPGFFQGVMTVVLKLFLIVEPARAYFGEKDYQQLQVIQEMVEDLLLPVDIVPCPTVREDSGLAESSRNRLLSPEGRAKAAAIFRALTTAPTVEQAKAQLAAAGFQIDYVEERWNRRLAAVFLEGIRLIDNVPAPER